MDSDKLSLKAVGETTPPTEMPAEPHLAVQVMHGITFSALVITFSMLFSTIAEAALVS